MLDGVVDIPLQGHPLGCSSSPKSRADRGDGLRRFVVGPENRLVETAVQSVLDGGPTRDAPIVFCGPAGVGKSHLAIGLAAAWKGSFPRRPVVSITAVDFARRLADAVETKTTDDFAMVYRHAALLVMEDVHHLSEKPAAQQELLYTLDALLDAGSRVVLTSRTEPARLAGIGPRLRSRLAAGLTVPVAPPGAAARLTILQRLAEAQHIDLAGPVAQLLADRLAATAAELRGALVQLQMSAELDGGTIDPQRVDKYLAERATSRAPTLEEIALAVARNFSLKVSQLRGSSRTRAVVLARGVAMFLARTLTGNTLQQIGHFFGRRDHTTVSHASHKTQELLDSEPAVRQAVLRLQEKFSGP